MPWHGSSTTPGDVRAAQSAQPGDRPPEQGCHLADRVGDLVDRPPSDVMGLRADGWHGTIGGGRDEPDIEMSSRGRVPTGHRMDIQMDRIPVQQQIRDSRLLSGFPQSSIGQGCVASLEMPTELQPPPDPGMVGEQDVAAGLIHHQGRCGQMAGHTGPGPCIRAGQQQPEVGLSQGGLAVVRRCPRL